MSLNIRDLDNLSP